MLPWCHQPHRFSRYRDRMQRPSLSSIMSFASQASEWLVLLILLAASTPPILFRRTSLTIVPPFNLLDGSWILDTSYKAAGGIWLGRDVAFTYGPLFQWLSSAPSRWIGISVGSILATWLRGPEQRDRGVDRCGPSLFFLEIFWRSCCEDSGRHCECKKSHQCRCESQHRFL